MRKRNIAGLAVTMALALGVIGATAYAESPPPSPSASPANPRNPKAGENETQEPSYTGSIQTPKSADTENEAGEAAALAGLAKLTESDARNAALAKFPRATVQKASLEDENGSVVWAIQLTDANKSVQEVKVDAGNGAILAVEAGGADNEKSGAED